MGAELTGGGQGEVPRDPDAVAEVGQGVGNWGAGEARSFRSAWLWQPGRRTRCAPGLRNDLEAAFELADGAAVPRQQVEGNMTQREIHAWARSGCRAGPWVTQRGGHRRAPRLPAPAKSELYDRVAVADERLGGSEPVSWGVLRKKPTNGLH